MKTNKDDDWEVISTYTNEDGLEDGFFIDITEIAKSCGFKWRFIITQTVLNNMKFEESVNNLRALLIKFFLKIKSGQQEYEDQIIIEEDNEKYWLFLEVSANGEPNMKLINSSDY